ARDPSILRAFRFASHFIENVYRLEERLRKVRLTAFQALEARIVSELREDRIRLERVHVVAPGITQVLELRERLGGLLATRMNRCESIDSHGLQGRECQHPS